ncbi:peptidase M15D vanX D-ala-D-ala dipeptidase (plasmid) [Gemmatirosa kalamazoonensis]|uniref:D-alanyl-D-alanine dipeptidase n=1 Tax=Gemmatirosa kalamazoonensis TaxID=861299 RepID=W0RRL4_9BACT|nr:M15 family metallopeptidase [Gemmatirosa kalamazoonensis]AHG93629.1 peptidase M15D vanX D-ala-D-ala dipeptidase [Gemmatirosa kalamazoonensis]
MAHRIEPQRTQRTQRTPTTTGVVLLCVLRVLCGSSSLGAQPVDTAFRQLLTSGKPAPAPPAWRALIGEYGATDSDTLFVLERDGRLTTLRHGTYAALTEVAPDTFLLADGRLTVERAGGKVAAVSVGGARLPKRALGTEDGSQFTITPLRPVAELRREALAATPPHEQGPFRPSDLVAVTTFDTTVHLDVRYATRNNFMRTPFYSSARAFLQRPAAEALGRASAMLRPFGYGLLVHDAYRPWYVTKMFWEGTPVPQRVFVADPAQGSRHNRGEAVDLTLYDLRTGKPAEMTGGYDEMTARSYPVYPGGTSLQRWQRDLLRVAMESVGFTVYDAEWWHFDFKDWRSYPIGTQTFEQLDTRDSGLGTRRGAVPESRVPRPESRPLQP